MSKCVSPPKTSLLGPVSGLAQISNLGIESEGVCFGIDDVGEQRDGSAAEVEKENNENKKARQVRMPEIPYRPTRKEIEEHCVSHWPFRPCCRHCVFGRAQGHPHRSRGSEDREFGRARPPTISMDHCFLGSADGAEGKKAHESPFLILFDSEIEAMCALAFAEKACKPWAVEYVFNVLGELGYSGVKEALKSDAAPDLCELKKLVAAKRSSPIVPLEVPFRSSKANGAVERAARAWQGQFRTLKSHLESD